MSTNSNSIKTLAANILSAYNAGNYKEMVDLSGRLLIATNWDNRACNINDAAFDLAYPTYITNLDRCHSMTRWINYFLKA